MIGFMHTPDDIILCVTGAHEASAFKLGDLAITKKQTVPNFLHAADGHEDWFNEAVWDTDPQQRAEARDVENAFKYLETEFPGAIRENALFTEAAIIARQAEQEAEQLRKQSGNDASKAAASSQTAI